MAEPAIAAMDTPEEDYSRVGTILLFKQLRRLMAQRQVLDYRLLALLRELDQRESISGRPFSLPAWLAEVFGMGYGAAREKVRTARALGHLPLIDDAFRDGKLSYSKVRALTRVARREDEARLLDIALDVSADALEKLVQRYKQRERLDDVQQLIRQRSLTYAWDVDGSLVVRARLTPEQGAIWLKALEKAEEVIDSDEEFQIRQADALTHALEESLLDRTVPSKSQTHNGTTESCAERPRVADHYQAVIHVPVHTLRHVPAGTPAQVYAEMLGLEETAVIENGPVLHAETVRRLTCDGALVSVLRGDEGEVLNVGRKTRVIPRAIRRALTARDEHCQYPGCGQSRFLSGHHIVHWADGGETKLDNLLLLCPKHHRYVHEYGLTATRAEKGFRFSMSRRTTQLE